MSTFCVDPSSKANTIATGRPRFAFSFGTCDPCTITSNLADSPLFVFILTGVVDISFSPPSAQEIPTGKQTAAARMADRWAIQKPRLKHFPFITISILRVRLLVGVAPLATDGKTYVEPARTSIVSTIP
jgi:hypothetical protein